MSLVTAIDALLAFVDSRHESGLIRWNSDEHNNLLAIDRAAYGAMQDLDLASHSPRDPHAETIGRMMVPVSSVVDGFTVYVDPEWRSDIVGLRDRAVDREASEPNPVADDYMAMLATPRAKRHPGTRYRNESGIRIIDLREWDSVEDVSLLNSSWQLYRHKQHRDKWFVLIGEGTRSVIRSFSVALSGEVEIPRGRHLSTDEAADWLIVHRKEASIPDDVDLSRRVDRIADSPARETIQEYPDDLKSGADTTGSRDSSEEAVIEAEARQVLEVNEILPDKVLELTSIQRMHFVWLGMRQSGMTGGKIRDAWNKRFPNLVQKPGKSGSGAVRSGISKANSILKKWKGEKV